MLNSDAEMEDVRLVKAGDADVEFWASASDGNVSSSSVTICRTSRSATGIVMWLLDDVDVVFEDAKDADGATGVVVDDGAATGALLMTAGTRYMVVGKAQLLCRCAKCSRFCRARVRVPLCMCVCACFGLWGDKIEWGVGARFAACLLDSPAFPFLFLSGPLGCIKARLTFAGAPGIVRSASGSRSSGTTSEWGEETE